MDDTIKQALLSRFSAYLDTVDDEPVPPEHFRAVAQVIGYVYRLQGKIPAR